MKRKLNPFVEDREASAAREISCKGVMPLERQRELPLAKPLSLEQFVALMMPPPNLTVGKPIFYKTDTHPTITNSNSDSGKLHASLHDQLTLNDNTLSTVKPFECTVVPGKSGETLLSRADTSPCERESVTHRFDCNTVGPVPVASGYGSSMLTHSAAYVRRDVNTHASSLQSEAIPLEMDRAPVVESRVSGIQITSFTCATFHSRRFFTVQTFHSEIYKFKKNTK